MDDTMLLNMWRDYDQKLEKSLALNKRLVAEVQKQKARTALSSLKNFKLAMIFFGFIWIFILGFLLFNTLYFQKIFFAVSVALILAVNIVAIGVYIYHIVLINQINNAENVITAQTKLAKLQASTLQIIRILFLQTPLYTTWFISWEWIQNSPQSFWLIEVPCVLLFTFIAIWLYRNIRYENKDKKWFRTMFSGIEFNPIFKAQAFLNEIEIFEK